MKETTTRVPAPVMRLLREYYEDVDPHKALHSIAEVMRMMALEEMMQTSDPAAEYFWELLYYNLIILRKMQTVSIEADAEKIKDLELKVARLTKRKKR